MSKNIQIPEELFADLVKYHMFGMKDEEIIERIKTGLQTKYDTIEKRTMYSVMRDKNVSPEERETARQQYLDSIGLSDSFRY